MRDELRLVQDVVDVLHDLVAHLHAHADVHGAGAVKDVVLLAQARQPLGPAAARGDDGLVGLHRQLDATHGLVTHHAAAYAVLHDDIVAIVAEDQLHALLLQVVLDGQIDLLRLLRTQMTDGAVHQFEARLDGALADLLDLVLVAQTLDLRVRAELQIDGIGVVDQLLGLLVADQLWQVAAHLGAQRQLAVGKRARA